MARDLYIIQSSNNGAFKVGISKNPERRLRQLQTGSPYKLKMVLVLKGKSHLESTLHERLKSFRLGNFKGEWFCYDAFPSLPDWIYDMLNLEEIDYWWKS
ncbi:GIY-YIG nuclease family protein [bacterium]|nr:GIY-YIG nuclease family protein [bacterium]